MDPQLFLSHGADIERPPTQLEVETELETHCKSGRGRSLSSKGPLPNARAEDRGLAATQNELHDFHNNMKGKIENVKGELEDVKAIVKQKVQNERRAFGIASHGESGSRRDPSNRQQGSVSIASGTRFDDMLGTPLYNNALGVCTFH